MLRLNFTSPDLGYTNSILYILNSFDLNPDDRLVCIGFSHGKGDSQFWTTPTHVNNRNHCRKSESVMDLWNVQLTLQHVQSIFMLSSWLCPSFFCSGLGCYTANIASIASIAWLLSAMGIAICKSSGFENQDLVRELYRLVCVVFAKNVACHT